MEIGYFESPIGLIKYEYLGSLIYSISFVFDDINKDQYNTQINHFLDGYFKGEIKEFPFNFYYDQKTDFQKKVLKALLEIPYGETRSYQDIAVKIGHPKAIRAVGQACKANPIGIMIPCHRVIGKNNKLTGYSGKDYIYLKEKLLMLEKKFK